MSEDGDATEPRRADAPLADLRDSLTRSGPDDDFDDLFDETGESVIDGEAAWDDLVAETEATPAVAAVVESDDDRDVSVIESRICHTCPYFATPPDVACTHDGTDIREVVDTDHFEVADCPMVVVDDFE